MSLRSLGCGEVTPEHYGTEQTFCGWVDNVRSKGNIAFLDLRDKTGTVQFVLLKKKLADEAPGLFDEVTKLHDESCVAIRGRVQESEKAKAGYEVLPTSATILNEAATPLPMALWDEDIDTGLDTRLDNRFLDLRTPRTNAIFQIRHEVLRAGSRYLQEQGFTQVHTSNIIAASSEGGTDIFPVEYFGRKCFLSQSPQLYKQMLMASGLDRVFEIARYFRAEKHKTVRHLNEATAFDFEMAWIEDEDDVMQAIEGLMHAVWEAVAKNCSGHLETLGVDLPVPELPFRRVPYEDALELINGRDGAAARLEKAIGKPALEFGDDIGTEAERILGEEMAKDGHDFYFITKWPLEAKPFYLQPEDGTQNSRLSRAFDLDYRGVELTSGGQRVHDPKLLEEGIVRWGLDPKDFESYLQAFRFGMPPHGGCGIGIERILMQMLGLGNIREAVLFPRDMDRVTP